MDHFDSNLLYSSSNSSVLRNDEKLLPLKHNGRSGLILAASTYAVLGGRAKMPFSPEFSL